MILMLAPLLWLALLWPTASRADSPEVLANGLLRVAVYKDFAPFSAGTGDDYSGLDISLARALAAQLGVNLKLLPFDAGESMSDDLRNMVWHGTVLGYGPADVMLHVPVDRRFAVQNDQVAIFAPYFRETLVLVYKHGTLPEAATADDLVGHAVAAEQGTAAAGALVGALGGALRDQAKITATPREAVDLLLSGRVSAALVTRTQAEAALLAAGQSSRDYAFATLALNGLPPNGWVVGLAVKADNAALVKALDAALAAMRKSGALQALYAQQGVTWVSP
jgi:ABC-type amino acid transport substrate-binding protein